MADYVELLGVRTWYDEHGDGEAVVLLHPGGAGVDARAWGPNLEALSAGFRVFTPERRGHGRTPDVDGPITFDLMAQDTIAFLETVVGEPAHLVGCSDGAIVALLVALRRPDLVHQLAFTAGVFRYQGWAPGCSTPRRIRPSFSSACTPSYPRTDPTTIPSSSRSSPGCTRQSRRSRPQSSLIVDFLTTDPVATLAPIRRA